VGVAQDQAAEKDFPVSLCHSVELTDMHNDNRIIATKYNSMIGL
jgi:hypothetical protein